MILTKRLLVEQATSTTKHSNNSSWETLFLAIQTQQHFPTNTMKIQSFLVAALSAAVWAAPSELENRQSCPVVTACPPGVRNFYPDMRDEKRTLTSSFRGRRPATKYASRPAHKSSPFSDVSLLVVLGVRVQRVLAIRKGNIYDSGAYSADGKIMDSKLSWFLTLLFKMYWPYSHPSSWTEVEETWVWQSQGDFVLYFRAYAHSTCDIYSQL